MTQQTGVSAPCEARLVANVRLDAISAPVDRSLEQRGNVIAAHGVFDGGVRR